MENLFKKKADNGDLKNAEIPFKLCFKSTVLMGRSYIHIGLPTKIPLVVAPKFYSAATDEPLEPEEIETIKRSLQTVSPNKKFERPLTENQKYGWYNIKFLDIPAVIEGTKLDFRIKKNQLIIEHLMNHEKIRE